MAEDWNPVYRSMEEVHLLGTAAVYDSQAAASLGIPNQWRDFLKSVLSLGVAGDFYGASPCAADQKIHYFSCVSSQEGIALNGLEEVTLVAGEYAVLDVRDPTLLREAWGWILGSWLPRSGRRERSAPEFERFVELAEDGQPNGSVEIWLPVELGQAGR